MDLVVFFSSEGAWLIHSTTTPAPPPPSVFPPPTHCPQPLLLAGSVHARALALTYRAMLLEPIINAGQ